MSTTNILDLNNRIDELEKNSGGGGSADSAKRSDIATEFSTETSYTAGNFVYHDGKLYQFNADHSAGAWDSTDVVEANVTDQIVSNKSAIDGLTASDVAYGDDTVADVLDAVKLRTATGTTLAELASAIGQLNETQKDTCIISVLRPSQGITYKHILRRIRIDEFAYCVIDAGVIISWYFSLSDEKLYIAQVGSTTPTDVSSAVTGWTLYYSGQPIS